MYKKIHLAGLAESALFKYAKDVPFFKEKESLSFEPGLTVLFGPNGCGKTTVLNMLGESMLATQGGVSTLTEAAIHQGVDMSWMRRKGTGMVDKFGLTVEHDGQPVVHIDPRKAVGLRGGAFDDDFFEQGILDVVSTGKQSHGQQALYRGSFAVSLMQGKATMPTEIRRTIDKKSVNNVWVEAIECLEKRLVASIPLGQPTLLLDEPESNFSVVWQARLWDLLSKPEISEKYQIIVATHSVFALGIPHANYVDFEPGYREEVMKHLRAKMPQWASA